MNKFLIILPLLSLFGKSFCIASDPRDSVLKQVVTLSSKYLNYNCSAPGDSVLRVCGELEKWAINHNDAAVKFRVEQLEVNALCLEGNIGSGINSAKEMYDEAKRLQHSLGKALALQSIAATYMYAGQYTQALAIFTEAEPLINTSGDSIVKINLSLQQLHTCMQLKDSLSMVVYLARVCQLVEYLPVELKEVYLYYIACYEAMLEVMNKQPERVKELLQRINELQPENKAFNIWRYCIQAAYYRLNNNFVDALVYVDSTLQSMAQYKNSNEYKELTYQKALLYEEVNDYLSACRMYFRVDSLTNILNVQYYTRLIENLHMTYFVDQVKIENARLRNEYLMYILLGSLLCMVIAVVMIIMARRRNKELVKSYDKLKEIRELTADSIQSKSMFLSNMSHDLRTPLNGIVGFTDVLANMKDIDPEIKEQCRDYIKQNSDLLVKLVDDIIDFSSLKNGEIKFAFGKHDVVALCRNVVQTVTNVKKTEAELQFTSTIEEMQIETDSGRLQQVLFNLLVNATKFTKKGYICLKLDFNPEKNEVVFIVEDTGCGIPLEKQARIFGRFEKLHESVQGVGLGLSICKLIIKHVNGEIWIDSTYTGGARFIFTHPVVHISKLKDI